MKLHLFLVAAALAFAHVNAAPAQTTTLNALGRHLGWGVSDGYHTYRLRGGGCAGCSSCEAATPELHVPAPAAAPFQHAAIQHAPVSQPVPAMQTWRPMPPASHLVTQPISHAPTVSWQRYPLPRPTPPAAVAQPLGAMPSAASPYPHTLPHVLYPQTMPQVNRVAPKPIAHW